MPIDPDVRRLALSCLLLGYTGPVTPRWISAALADGLGGLVLFGSNLADGRPVCELTDRLRADAGHDVVLALDEEGGDVTRLDAGRGSPSPGAAALGHLDDPEATERAYAAIGARLAASGVTLDLAPVADVNTDPRNPVIGVRSFGAEPERVAGQVAAAVRGLQSQGVAACAKHFPGHGATSSDSHHEVAAIRSGREELDTVELPPFQAAIAAGTRAVMTGHLLVPALDPHRLATVSPAITTELLRTELGFGGAVVTDALEMRAVSATIGMVDAFVQALAAGADTIETGALDYPELVDAIPAAVQQALDDGTLTRARLEDAAARTAALATRPDAPHQPVDVRDLGARCIDVTGELPALDRPLVVEARPPGGMASGELPWSFGDALADRLPDTRVAPVDASSDLRAIGEWAAGHQVVVVLRDPVRHPWQRHLLELNPAVIVDVGWPAELPPGLPTIRTRGVSPALLAAAADRLAGRIPVGAA